LHSKEVNLNFYKQKKLI